MDSVELTNKGKDIEDILKAMDIPCTLQDVSIDQFSEHYEFILKDAKTFSAIPKAITVLKTCFHTTEISLVDSKNDYKGVSRIPFAIEIKTQSMKPIESFAIQKLDKENKYNAFLGLDNKMQPVYWDIKNSPNMIIAGAMCCDLSKIIKNILSSLYAKNVKNSFLLAIIDTKGQLSEWEKFVGRYDRFFSLYSRYPEYGFNRILRHIEDIIQDMIKKSTSKTYKRKRIILVINDWADAPAYWMNFYLNKIINFIKNSNVEISIILATQFINGKVLTSVLKNYFLTRVCFKTNTPSESTSILGSNKASKIQTNDVAIIKNIETSEEKEIKIVDLVEREEKAEVSEEKHEIEMQSGILDKYLKLKEDNALNTMLQNFFKRYNNIKYFDLFAGLSNKCMVVTNSTFTKSAIELAKANNVELWDRMVLKEKLEEV